ncbi:MAG: hypothetical protein ACRD29_01390 [Acidimicrobiales bacterium]
MRGGPADELCAGYEALRAAATGSVASETPRGLALMLAQGLPAWVRAWAPLPPPAPVASPGERPVAPGVGAEMVRVLTEMALGCRSTLAAS